LNFVVFVIVIRV